MADYQRILFPVDLSEGAPGLIDHVLTMANKFQAELHILYVVRAFESPSFGDYIPGPEITAVQDELTVEMGRELDSFVEKHLPDYSPKKVTVISGHTGREILNYAERENIDLIIMGTHGRTAVGRFFFGSVAQRVVLSSDIPVMVIRP